MAEQNDNQRGYTSERIDEWTTVTSKQSWGISGTDRGKRLAGFRTVHLSREMGGFVRRACSYIVRCWDVIR